MSLRIIDRDAVRQALPMAACIDQMALAMRAVSNGEVTMPSRQVIPLADGSGFLGLMPGSGREPPAHGIKVLTICPRNAQSGRPVIQGMVAVFDPETGAPAAVIDAASVTAIRTAAVSGLATRLLAREDARTLALIGSGVQAESHLEAMCAVRPITHVRIWNRTRASAEAFCQRHDGRFGCRLEVADTAAAAVAGADIVCTVTAAAEPVVRNDWITPGTHLNLVGSHDAQHREVDEALIARAMLVVDHRGFAETQAGEIVAALAAGLVSTAHFRTELGDLVQQAGSPRLSGEQITLFKSLGLVAQDLYAADLVLRNAAAEGLGVSCPF